MKGRKKYDAKFKAKVTIEAIQERSTLNELASKYELSPVMISRWKKEFIENSATAFEAPKSVVANNITTENIEDNSFHIMAWLYFIAV